MIWSNIRAPLDSGGLCKKPNNEPFIWVVQYAAARIKEQGLKSVHNWLILKSVAFISRGVGGRGE